MHTHLENLNPEQLKAVQHLDGPILILAGAGSGKTRVLTRRVAHLVLQHGVNPDRILAVTFTNKATKEMKERLQHLLGEQANRLWVSTFHSAALRILRIHATKLGYQPGFVVYDTQDSSRLLKRILEDLKVDTQRYPANFFTPLIDSAKNWFILPEQYQEWSKAKAGEKLLVSEVYETYQRELLRANAMDFGDLLVNVLRLLKEHSQVRELYQHQLKYLLIDEFQDTNEVQYQLVRILAAKHGNILVVGDDDQSIYGFRGANISNILNFEKDFPKATVIKLEQNYRSTKNVLNAANEVIAKNKSRKGKKLWSEGENGELIRTFVGYDEEDEARFIRQQIQRCIAEGIQLKESAIFYRTNAQSRALEEALLSAKIPYRIFGAMRFYERKEIKDIVAYLRLLVNPKDNEAFLRVVNTPTRGVGPQAQTALIERAAKNGIGFLEAAIQLVEVEQGGGKGLRQFVELIKELQKNIEKLPLAELIAETIEKSGYAAKLKSSKEAEAESRLENLGELVVVARVYGDEDVAALERLRQFLDRVSLTGGDELVTAEAKDAVESQPAQFVSLMTLHLAKGLEFDLVFLTGFEDGFLPHQRAMLNPEEVEEERRLCYVGITRAKKILYLTRATTRGFASAASSFGASGRWRDVSQFAIDIPEELTESLGGDFFRGGVYSDPSIEIDQEALHAAETDDTEEHNGWFGRKKKKKTSESFNVDSALLSAEEVGDPFVPAPLEELKVGAHVVHNVFGNGVITGLEGVGANRKALVLFDGFEREKKVVLKHARLGLS